MIWQLGVSSGGSAHVRSDPRRLGSWNCKATTVSLGQEKGTYTLNT